MSDKPINIYITGGNNQILPNATTAIQNDRIAGGTMSTAEMRKMFNEFLDYMEHRVLTDTKPNETPKSTIMDETIAYSPFADINLSDSFFDSLKADYPGFEDWFKRKAMQGAKAYMQQTEEGVQAFLYLKDGSNVVIDDVRPSLPACKRLKVGTFKIIGHNTTLGERFVKKIMDEAVGGNYDEVYVTIFPREQQEPLIKLLERFGFNHVGMKGGERVYVKNMKFFSGDILRDYPLFNPQGKRKFVLSIYPKYHTRLFPDSILNNEQIDNKDLIKDISHTNSIHKIYICYMSGTQWLQRGDLIAIYRTSDGKGAARYRSVVTSICQVEEVRTKSSFASKDEYLRYCHKYSIFTDKELDDIYNSGKQFVVLKMTYNAALTKRITNGCMQNELGIHPSYWGFFQLSDAQFNSILQRGEVNEGLIVNQA